MAKDAERAEALIRGLRWKTAAGGGLYAPVGPKKLLQLFDAFGLPNKRPPHYGMEVLLHDEKNDSLHGNSLQIWVENGGGRLTVKVIGNYSKALPGLGSKAKLDRERSPWQAR